MSLMIKGVQMPKQNKVKTVKGKLKLWTIRNERVGRDEQFGAGVVPCDLNFAHDGTVAIDILGKMYPVVNISSPHGNLIDREKLIKTLRDEFCYSKISDNCIRKNGCLNCMLYAVLTFLEETPIVIESDNS